MPTAKHTIRPNPGGQSQFLRSTALFPAMIGGLFSGKTWAGSAKIIQQHVYFDGTDSLCIAPTFSNLRQITIPALVERLEEAEIAYDVNLGDMMIRTPGLHSAILLHSGLNAERITGITCGRAWIDEPGRIPDFPEPHRNCWKNAIARVRDPTVPARARQVMVTGTHEGKGTWLYRDWEQKPKRGHRLYRASSYENPIAREYADILRDEYGEELSVQYVYGHAAESSMAAVKWSVLEEAQDSRATKDFDLARLSQVPYTLYSGVDIGRSKSLTVIWIVSDRDGELVTEAVVERRNLEFHKQSELINAVMELPNSRVMAIDATYAPQTAEDAELRWGPDKIKRIVFNPTNKMEIYSRWIKMLQMRRIVLPFDEDVMADFYAVKRVVTSAGKVSYAAPFTEDGHSDRASACSLAIEAAQYVVPEINFVGGAPLVSRGARRS